MKTAFAALRSDFRRAYEISAGGHLARLWNCVQSPGVHAVVVYRFGRWVTGISLPFKVFAAPFYFALNVLVRMAWGIDLPRHARIGPGLYIGHFGGITISRHAVIGRNCNLSQKVTIGLSGQGANAGAPVIGDDVYIAPGACLFGSIRVGNNVKIGANAVIHRDVPDNAVVVLDPGFRVISLRGNRSRPAPGIAACGRVAVPGEVLRSIDSSASSRVI